MEKEELINHPIIIQISTNGSGKPKHFDSLYQWQNDIMNFNMCIKSFSSWWLPKLNAFNTQRNNGFPCKYTNLILWEKYLFFLVCYTRHSLPCLMVTGFTVEQVQVEPKSNIVLDAVTKVCLWLLTTITLITNSLVLSVSELHAVLCVC